MVIDEKSFTEIYDQFAQKIYKFCYFRVSSKEEAEDISTQVFIKAWDHVSNGKEITNVQGFLYRIASNLIIDFYRRKKDKRDLSIDDPNNPIDIADSSDIVSKLDTDLLLEDVNRHLEKLPASYEEIIRMRYLDDLSIKEIAQILKTSENNISVRIYRAIEKLKKIT